MNFPLAKKCMAIRTLSDTASGWPNILIAIHVSQSKLAWLTPNLGILLILVCSFLLCGSILANPITYRLIPSPSWFENWQYLVKWKPQLTCYWWQHSTNHVSSLLELRWSLVEFNACSYWLIYCHMAIANPIYNPGSSNYLIAFFM